MPRVVDHRERRRQVAMATADLISQMGVEAVTIRAIADHLGYSTAIVQHYFPNKRQLLLYTHHLLSSSVERQLREILANDPANITDLIKSLLPLSERARQRWQMWLAYRGTSMIDKEYAEAHHRLVHIVREIIEDCLRASHDHENLAPRLDLKVAARRFMALVHGVGVEALFDKDDWPPETQLAIVLAGIRDMTGLDIPGADGNVHTSVSPAAA